MSNNPPVIVELTKDEADFLEGNCDANIQMALGLLQNTKNRSTAEKLLKMYEFFKSIRTKVRNARDL